jgi:hypothetical protein
MHILLENRYDLELRTRVSYLKKENIILSKEKNKENTKNFYDFCKLFFSLWDKYFEKISLLNYQFNSEKTNLYFKIIYAEMIAEQYGKYLNDLVNLEIPCFIDKSFNQFLNSIKFKRIFFNLYSADPDNKDLDNIKDESDSLEEQFWVGVYKENSEIERQVND